MPTCPEGFTSGFGLPPTLVNAVCVSRSYFPASRGEGVYVAGTGFYVGDRNGRSLVLTAAHNLFHQTHGNARYIDLYFGRRGDASMAMRRATSAVYPDEFKGGAALERWDFGLCRVDPLGTDRFAPFALAKSAEAGAETRLLVGYPNEGTCQGDFMPFHAEVTVGASSPHNYRYRNQPSYEGMSGGPLLASTAGVVAAFGLHTLGGSGDNHRAIRFSDPVLGRIATWL